MSFFHTKALNRYQRNLIHGLCDANVVWKKDERRIESIVMDYFADIFKSNGSIDASKVVEVVQLVVTDAMNLGLIQKFHVAEVARALKQMHPKKPQNLTVCLLSW